MGDGFENQRLMEELPIQLIIPVTDAGIWSGLIEHLSYKLDLYGWADEMRWCLIVNGATSGTFYILVGSQVVSVQCDFLNRTLVFRAAAADSIIIMKMFIEKILESIALVGSRPHLDSLILEVTKISSANKMIRKTMDQFPPWKSELGSEQLNDPLMKLLIEKYEIEHNNTLLEASVIIRDVILNTALMYGWRFVSISGFDLVILEGSNALPHLSKSSATAIALALDIGGRGYSDGQGRAGLDIGTRLHGLHWGVYDLRSQPFEKVAPNITRNSMVLSKIQKTYDSTIPLKEWLDACGAVGGW